MMRFRIYGVEPMGAVRTTQRQKFKDVRAIRYRNYKIYIALKVKQHAQCAEPTTAPCAVNIRFIMPIPDSWAKKKKDAMAGKPHMSKPDIDNMIKGVFDSVNGLIWVDDNQVFEVNASKVYEDKKNPVGIEMEVVELF